MTRMRISCIISLFYPVCLTQHQRVVTLGRFETKHKWIYTQNHTDTQAHTHTQRTTNANYTIPSLPEKKWSKQYKTVIFAKWYASESPGRMRKRHRSCYKLRTGDPRIFSPGPQSATSLLPKKFFATLLHQASGWRGRTHCKTASSAKAWVHWSPEYRNIIFLSLRWMKWTWKHRSSFKGRPWIPWFIMT